MNNKIIFKLVCLGLISLFSCHLRAMDTTGTCASSYDLDINTTTHFDFGSGSLTRQQFDAQLSVMKLKADIEHPQATWWAIQLSNIATKINGEPAAAEPGLENPYALLKQDNGKIIDFRFAPQQNENTRQQLRGMSYLLQFPDASQWPAVTTQRKESDTIGEFTAQYEPANYEREEYELQKTAPEKAELAFRKTKLQYHSSDNMRTTENNPIQQIDVQTSIQDIALNTCGFNIIKGEENLNFKGTGDSFSMKVEQQYSLNANAELAQIDLWTMPLDINAWDIPQPNQVTLSEEELKALEQQFNSALGQTDIMSMRGSELAQWLAQFDPVISLLRDELLSARFDDKQKMRMFNALGHLDSDNGNQLLVTLINDTEFSETDRFRAIRAITTGTSELSPALKAQLSAVLDNEEFIGSEALYGATLMTLGAVLQRRAYNELSSELFTELTQRLVNSESEHQQSALVASLGNSQMPEAVMTLKDYSQSTSARVRANVAASLGQIADDAAQQELKSMLQREPDDKVQQAVLGAIGQFELDNNDLQKIAEIAQQSDSERTRGNAIKALAKQTHHNQQVQQQLKQLMRTESSRRNFVLAAQSLEALRKQSDDN